MTTGCLGWRGHRRWARSGFPMFLYYLGSAFTILMLVDAYRRGQLWPWLWIMLFFNPLGALIYFVLNVQTVVPLNLGGATAGFRTQRFTASDLRRAEADARRVGTAAAWADYATMLRSRKRYQAAVEAADQALAKDPGDEQARYERGRALFDLGRAKEAVVDLEPVVDADPGHDYGDAALALAFAHEAAGDPQAARRRLEQLAERSSRPEVIYHLALLQEAAGDRELALHALRGLISDHDMAPDFARRQGATWVRRAKSAVRRLEKSAG